MSPRIGSRSRQPHQRRDRRRSPAVSVQDLVDAPHGGGAALEDVDDPAQRDDRPGELHHVGVEGDEAADGDAVPSSTSRPPSHSTSTTAKPSMVSSVGHSIPISRTSFRLRAMYSLFVRLEAARSRLLPARRRGSGARRRSSPARGRRCRRTWPGCARSARGSCGRSTAPRC